MISISPQLQQQQQQQKAQLVRKFGQFSDTLLSRKQEEQIAKISHLSESRPSPQHLSKPLLELVLQQQGTLATPTPPQPRIDTIQQFNAWLNGVENAAKETDADEDEEQMQSSRKLLRYAQSVNGLKAQCIEWSEAINEISDLHRQVSERTNQVHGRAGSLTQNTRALEALLEAMERRLWYFDQLEPLTKRLFSSTINLLPGGGGILSDLDQCISFLNNHRKYREAENYLVRYRQLQNRALGTLKAHIVDSFSAISTVAEQQHKQQQQTKQLPPSTTISIEGIYENIENCSAFRQFRVLATRLQPHCAEIERRVFIDSENSISTTSSYSPSSSSSINGELNALLTDCHSAYFHQRKLLLSSVIQTSLNSIFSSSSSSVNQSGDNNDLPTNVRNACNLITRVVRGELSLYSTFFKKQSKLTKKLIEWLSSNLEYYLRPQLIRASNIDSLCASTSILRSLNNNSTTTVVEKEGEEQQQEEEQQQQQPLFESFSSMLKDSQERITFLAQKTIQSEISSFNPNSTTDLDYPNKIIIQQQQQQQQQLNETTTTSTTDISSVLQNVYATWYPTLQKALMLLSKLYLTVEMSVFEGLAQEIVESCILSLEKASLQIISNASDLDGQLFLIRHLLTLREQIAPFEASFTITSVVLDFSHTRTELSKAIRSGEIGRLFTFDAFTPRISTDRRDSRLLLDRKLTESIEKFIVGETKRLAQPLFSLLLQISSFEKVQSSHPNPQQLSTQPWASQKCFEEIALNIIKTLHEEVPKLVQKVILYLTSQQTRAVILPIRDNILDSWDCFLSTFNRTHSSSSNLPQVSFEPVIDQSSTLSEQEQQQEQEKQPVQIPNVATTPRTLNSFITVSQLSSIFDSIIPQQ